MKAFVWEFLLFGLKQAWACVFAASFMAVMLLSHHVHVPGLARYDFLCLAAVAIQILLLVARIETLREALVLALFHAVGLGLELHKTRVGSWNYPEPGVLKIGIVPVFSGFMYAAVASYMCQSFRHLRLELRNYPRYRFSVPLAAAIYANFFTNQFLPDGRWVLIGLVFVVFGRTWVDFTVWRKRRTMPLVLSFVLIGFFVWVAENYSTFFGAWVYAHQRGGWQAVSPRILASWFLLVIVSFILVADLKHRRQKLGQRQPEAKPDVGTPVASTVSRRYDAILAPSAGGVPCHAPCESAC
jgi:uncharacterized membrane protein YoaT (DUF817 family)